MQALGGAAETAAGVAVGAGGAGAAATGVGTPPGVAAAAVGAFLASNGVDNFVAGWRALTTGEFQPTRVNEALLAMGLTPAQAAVVEIGLAGGAGAAALKGPPSSGLSERASTEPPLPASPARPSASA